MPSVRGLIGYNRSGSTSNLLIGAFGNDLINISNGLGFGFGINNINDVSLEPFLDRIFFQNNSDTPITFNGTVWSREYVGRTPISKYQQRFSSRLFLGNCGFIAPQAPLDTTSTAITFPSRVFYSDVFIGNTLSWGIDWGRNGATTAGSTLFRVTTTGGGLVQDFVANNIKIGDPLFITNGDTSLTSDKPYTVTKILSSYSLQVDRNFPVTTTGQHFWVGRNWFDVEADDNDQITGFGSNSGRLLIFKLLSLHYFGSIEQGRRSVKGAKGTSSQRSILNDDLGNSYYFHAANMKLAGIYKFNSVSSAKISRSIDPFIRGMSTDNFNKVVGWREGNELRWYLGDLTNTNFDISIINAVATLNLDTDSFSVDPIADIITVSTTFRTGQTENSYCGTNDSQVLKMDDGYTFNGAGIVSTLETKVYYPAGSEIICNFPWIQIVGRNVRGTRLKYKLWDNPIDVDSSWWPLGDLIGDKTEFPIPPDHNTGAGIQFKFDEIGTQENDAYIEKISIFYKPDRMRLL